MSLFKKLVLSFLSLVCVSNVENVAAADAMGLYEKALGFGSAGLKLVKNAPLKGFQFTMKQHPVLAFVIAYLATAVSIKAIKYLVNGIRTEFKEDTGESLSSMFMPWNCYKIPKCLIHIALRTLFLKGTSHGLKAAIVAAIVGLIANKSTYQK